METYSIPPLKPKNTQIKRRLFNILTGVFLTICILILTGAVYAAIHAKKSDEAVSVAGYQPYMIATGSMEPTFQVKGLVFIHDGGFEKVKVGDVVAFKAEAFEGQTALHRVVAVISTGEETQFIVKGDNNPYPDGAAVTLNNYIGRVVWHTNITSAYFNILHRKWGFAAAIILPIAVIILIVLATRWLTGSCKSWQGKTFIISVIIFIISTAVFTAYFIL